MNIGVGDSEEERKVGKALQQMLSTAQTQAACHPAQAWMVFDLAQEPFLIEKPKPAGVFGVSLRGEESR
ncbi:hypothetical protein C8P63_10453 [Melghirimyces profundicolus]|uniref:Uncharacterized protein n=1 Tax=Melghirimyces profundicolus TaxID=1242148 RepID=A0A2T6C4F8_9BACL|nr:hypothetical protein C8P63_10453 [Melghirimyces profundicolus]